MDDIRARIRVGPDQTITRIAPVEVPPGEHEITIELAPAPRRQLPKRPLELTDLPSHDLGPWPKGLRLRREDLYDEDGR